MVVSGPEREWPFPWSDSDGLCEVLRDQNLWASLVPRSRVRHFIKAVAKKSGVVRRLGRSTIVQVDDDETIGRLIIEILASRDARRRLIRESQGIALRDLGGRLISSTIESIDKLCSRESPEQNRSNLRNLVDVLKKDEFKLEDLLQAVRSVNAEQDEEIRALALIACGFGLIQPGVRWELVDVLCDKDPRLTRLLTCGDTQQTLNEAANLSLGGSDPDIQNVGAPVEPKDLPLKGEAPELDAEFATLLAEISDRLQRSVGCTREIGILTEKGQFGRIREMLHVLETLREETQGVVAKLAERLDPSGTLFPSPTDECFAQEEAGRGYLVALRSACTQAHQSARRQVAVAVKAFASDLAALGLPRPEALDTIETTADLDRVRNDLGPVVQREQAFKAILRGAEDARARIASLPAESRLLLYRRLVEEPKPTAQVLELIVEDQALQHQSPVDLRRLLELSVTRQLDAKRPIPGQFWRALAGVEPRLVEFVSKSEIADRLIEMPPDHSRLLELAELIRANAESLPFRLRTHLRRAELSTAPLDERIKGLAQLAENADLDNETLHELLSCLVTAGRTADALFLASLLGRAGVPIDDQDDALTEILFGRLLDDVKVAGELIQEMSDELVDMVTSADRLAVLLGLAHQLGHAELAYSLRYRKRKEFDALREARPALLRSWRLSGFLAEIEDDPAHSLTPTGGQATIPSELEHALQKASCYGNWPQATQYQKHFLDFLNGELKAAQAGNAASVLSSDDVIDDVSKKHHLKPAMGKGRKAMLKYLDETRELIDGLRVQGTASAIPPVEEAATERQTETALSDEFARKPGGASLQAIYDHAAMELKCAQ